MTGWPSASVRVAIDASSAVAGGGLTYLRQLLPRLVQESGLTVGPILVRNSTLAELGIASSDYDLVAAPTRLGALSAQWQHRIRLFDADVIFAPTEISFSIYRVPLVLAVRYPGFPRAHVQEYSLKKRAGFRLHKGLARFSKHTADAYIAVSQHAAAVAVAELGVAPDRIAVVYHGGPTERRPAKRGPARNFLFVSNLYRYKNVIRLLQAFTSLKVGDLWIVGEVMEEEFGLELRALVRDAGLGRRIQLRGALHGPDLVAAYEWADCFVWPPYAETFGHPLLEAHSFGLPIIAARASSNAEIAGDAAVYFDPFSTAELRRLLTGAVEEGVNTSVLPREYSWDICSRQTAEVLRRAARERPV